MRMASAQILVHNVIRFVTESAKTGLICTKYIYLFYHIHLFFCVGYRISTSFIEFLTKVCVYDEIFGKMSYVRKNS